MITIEIKSFEIIIVLDTEQSFCHTLWPNFHVARNVDVTGRLKEKAS